MREDGNNIILDKEYEKKLGLLPEHFPLSDAPGAMAELIEAAREEGAVIKNENQRRFRRSLPSVEHKSAYTVRGNQIAFMISDLAGIATRNGVSL